VDGLAQLLHGAYEGCRYMAMLDVRAFCDESYAHVASKGEKPFVIAGYLAPAATWMEFAGRWNMSLHAEGLPYFHMADCDGGHGVFAGRSSSERERLQRRFIGIINQFPLRGVSAGVSQAAIAQLHDELARFRAPRPNERQSMVTPYLFAFEVCINEMLLQMESLPSEERLAFVFDNQHEFEGRAHKVRAILLGTESYRNRHRIGALTYEDKRDIRGIPLQAADVLAYEVMRSLRDSANRWQMEELRLGYGITTPVYYSPEHVTAFAQRLLA
jgi:hypothetical protein